MPTPIPSTDVTDFLDNVKDFDSLCNLTAGTYVDRFGNTRLSVAEFFKRNGYETPVAFASGISVSRVTQTVTYSGNTYHALATAIPFTTTGTFNAAQWELMSGLTRQELGAEYGSGLVGAATYAQLRAYTGDATRIQVGGRAHYFDGASGIFVRTGSASDNDGTVLVDALGRSWVRQFDGPHLAAWFGVSSASADNTSALNAAILAAFLYGTAGAMQSGRVSVVVELPSGADITILGTALLPSGVHINGNGCRFVGADASAGTTIYSSALQSAFKTARWNSTALVSNHDAPNETTYRVLNAKLFNCSFVNVGCPLDLVNFQEHCEVQSVFFDNTSAPIRTKGSFYARYGDNGKLLARNSSLASGQPAMLLYGAAAHELKIDISAPSASVTVKVTATNSFSVELNGSAEEGYASNSVGLLNDGAYCQAWHVAMYYEGVRIGIQTINSGTFNASDFTPSYFSGCEYAVKAGVSGFRGCDFDAVSAPDEGAGIRNLLDFSTFNNDVSVRIPSKTANTTTGPSAFQTNILLSGQAVSEAQSVWRNTADQTDTLALADSAAANQYKLNKFAFEGSHIKTIANQVPFATITTAVNTLTIDTSITFDASNVLAFNFHGNTDSISFNLRGFIFGDYVQWAHHDPAGVVATVTNNGGIVRIVFTNLTASVPVINVSGAVRHV